MNVKANIMLTRPRCRSYAQTAHITYTDVKTVTIISKTEGVPIAIGTVTAPVS